MWSTTCSALLLVCVALAVGLGIAYPGFLSVGNFFVTLLSVTSIGIAGLGETALLISGNVDLSIGGQYAFIGIVNTKNLYWLALVYAAVVFATVRWAVSSSPRCSDFITPSFARTPVSSLIRSRR